MKVGEDRQSIIFETTGRKVYCNHGVVGIDDLLKVSEGYDGGIFDSPTRIYPNGERWPLAKQGNYPTPDEAAELADYMIALWTQFKQEYEKK